MATVKELKNLARDLGVKGYYKLCKEDLIWAIQEAEGNDACFHRLPDCGLEDCAWRQDCLPEA